MNTNICFAILFFVGCMLSAFSMFYANYQGETLVAVISMIMLIISILKMQSFLRKYEQSL